MRSTTPLFHKPWSRSESFSLLQIALLTVSVRKLTDGYKQADGPAGKSYSWHWRTSLIGNRYRRYNGCNISSWLDRTLMNWASADRASRQHFTLISYRDTDVNVVYYQQLFYSYSTSLVTQCCAGPLLSNFRFGFESSRWISPIRREIHQISSTSVPAWQKIDMHSI